MGCLGVGGQGVCAQGLALQRGGRCCAPAPLRCSMPWPRGGTHCALAALRSGSRRKLAHEARCARWPRPLRFSAPRKARQPLGTHALPVRAQVHQRLHAVAEIMSAPLRRAMLDGTSCSVSTGRKHEHLRKTRRTRADSDDTLAKWRHGCRRANDRAVGAGDVRCLPMGWAAKSQLWWLDHSVIQNWQSKENAGAPVPKDRRLSLGTVALE